MLFKTQWKRFKQKTVFRFLLRKGHWVYSNYSQNKDEALDKAIRDLSPEDDNISIFIVKSDEKIEDSANEIELITFFYAASVRDDIENLYYVDINASHLCSMELNIRHNPKTLPAVINSFYSDRHYELYYITNENRRKIAELIFNKISQLPEQKPLCMNKDKLRQTKNFFHQNDMKKDTNLDSFAPWAKQ